MKEEKAKVSVEQIYRSRLTEKCVTYDDGWMHWEAPREPEPTGYPEMDALGKLLARTPVPSVQAVTVAMGMPASILRAFVQGYTGMTVTKLIVRYRLLVGEELLRCTDLDLHRPRLDEHCSLRGLPARGVFEEIQRVLRAVAK